MRSLARAAGVAAAAKARNVLVLNPGTSASSAYFAPLGRTVVERLPNWQVWAVERRENLFEDHSALDLVKKGLLTGQDAFDYRTTRSSTG